MKKLLYTSLVLAGLTIITELFYLARTTLALVIIGLAVAIGLQGIYLLKKIKEVELISNSINKTKVKM